METSPNGGRPFNELSRAIAYLLGGMFLVATTSGLPEMVILLGRVFGIIFIGSAFFMAVSSVVGTTHAMVRWANSVNKWLFLALFIASLGNLIAAVVSPEQRGIYIVLAAAFFSIIVVALLLELRRTAAKLKRTLGSRLASVRLFSRLALVLGLFALATIIADVSIMGGPLLHLTIALCCLSAAFVLDRET